MRLALVAGRVPQSYVDQLDQIGEATGKCRSELVKDAIAELTASVDLGLDALYIEGFRKRLRCRMVVARATILSAR